MKCPKCGFGASGESCPRCGIVFSKWRPSRPWKKRRPPLVRPPVRSSGPSFLNILLLVAAFSVLAVVSLHFTGRWWRESSLPETGSAPPAVASSTFPSSSGPLSDEADEDAVSEPADNVLYLSGLLSRGTSSPRSQPERSRSLALDLPPLSRATISSQVVERVAELAGENPQDEGVRHYVAQAYLVLASRLFSQGRYRESLQACAGAEDWGGSPKEVARSKARIYQELHDLARAQEWAQAALAFGPDPLMYKVLGDVYYYREELGKAIEAWEYSLSLREDPTVWASLEKAQREAKLAKRFDRQRLSHFIVSYKGETMEDTGRMVLSSLEKSYSLLKSRLSFEPTEPIVVILYSRRDYSELGGPRWSAGLFDGKVRVPVRGLERLDGHVESTLLHELSHAFLFAQAGRNCPRWLQEGTSEYFEGRRTREFGAMLAEKVEADGDFAYCLIASRCDVRYFYPASTSLVEYLIQARGMGGIRDLLSLLGEGRTIDKALEEVTGRDEMGLVKDWEHFIKRRY